MYALMSNRQTKFNLEVKTMTNKANRQVCDVDIRDLKTKEPFMYFDTANTTTQSLTGESVNAMARGAKRISFQNPLDGTATIVAQIMPIKFYAMMSNGEIESDGIYADKKVIKCETAGELTVPAGTVTDSVFVYPTDEFANDELLIKGTVSGTKFTAAELTVGEEFEVGYIVKRTGGVAKVSFNNKKAP